MCKVDLKVGGELGAMRLQRQDTSPPNMFNVATIGFNCLFSRVVDAAVGIDVLVAHLFKDQELQFHMLQMTVECPLQYDQ